MLEQYAVSQLFGFLLVFCRLGSALMLMPGFGEAYVLPRYRLFFALTFSLILAPTLTLPPAPSDTVALFGLIVIEILVGVFMGAMSRIVISTIHLTGMIIAYQLGLASAVTQDFNQAQGQGTVVGNFLSIFALLLLFSLNLHHMMINGLAESYRLFSVGATPPLNDMALSVAKLVNGSFSMAMQLAAPHIVIGTIMYAIAGVIARLMPNLQVFFLLMSPQILIGLCVLMMVFSSMMLAFSEYFRANGAGLSPVM